MYVIKTPRGIGENSNMFVYGYRGLRIGLCLRPRFFSHPNYELLKFETYTEAERFKNEKFARWGYVVKL